jgi:hypothetical protein
MRCLALFAEEIRILEAIEKAQETMKCAVTARKWVNFEMQAEELNLLGERFEALERERAKIFPAHYRGAEAPAIYTLIAGLPAERRSRFTECYRQIKMHLFRIKLANESLLAYIAEARSTVGDFLEAAFPDRKGRLYSRQGAHVHSDMRSMVLDRSL